MDPDGARPVGIESRMQNLAESEIHIGLQIADRLRFSKKERYFGHSVLSARLLADRSSGSDHQCGGFIEIVLLYTLSAKY